jgi:predicted metal-binding protein
VEKDVKLTLIKKVEQLNQEAKKHGATSSAILSSKEIQAKDNLAKLCNGETTCPNYGQAGSCPPHVEGPAQFRKWQRQSEFAIAVKIDLPTSVMFSDERKGVMQMLHQIVATVEQKAIEAGFNNSRAFAGGSCKQLFCEDQENCCVVAGRKPCRDRDVARPSMSGFGIDVARLMQSCGWSSQKAEKPHTSDSDETSWVAGLVLLA